MKQWPNIGNKITYKGTSKSFWFTNIIKDAEELLEIGKEYTLSEIKLASSWCGVVLEEFPDKKFSLSFFKYPEVLTTEQAMSITRASEDTQKYEYVSLKDLKDKDVH
jgi:hypothetical protein